MITIEVDSRLRLDPEDLSSSLLQAIKNEFTHPNPVFHRKRAMGFFPGKEKQYISTFELDENGQFTLPRGGTTILRRLLDDEGLRYRFVDNRVEGTPIEVPSHKLNLYPYQLDAVEACFQKQNCLLRSPTGSGKTTVGINLITKVARPTIVIVWSSALAKQWMDRLTNELGIPKRSIGQIMGGKVDVQPITIAMQQTLYSRSPEKLGVDKHFGLLIADEVQRFAATTFRQVTEPFHAKWRIGISADETRNDGKEFLIYDVFGQVAYEINQQPLVQSGYIHNVEVRIIPTEFRADWYAQTKDFIALTEAMSTDKERNLVVMKALEFSFQDGGNSAMVFSHRVPHCQVIDSLCAERGIKSGLMLGGVDWATTFDQTRFGLKEGKLQVGIGTIQAIGQGIDVPAVDRGVIATPIGSNRQQFGQVRGRICRTTEGKRDAIIYYLWDQHVHGIFPLRNLTKWNSTVSVLDGDEWIPVNAFVQQLQRRNRRNG